MNMQNTNNEDLFLSATRQKFRFNTTKGEITVEDLFDLPLTSKTNRVNLDDIARGLYAEIQNTVEVSFVSPQLASNKLLKDKLEVVKAVIAIKVQENAEAANEADRKQKKQQILQAIENRRNNDLSNMSLEDLEKSLAAL